MSLGNLSMNPGTGGSDLPDYTDSGSRRWVVGITGWLVSAGSPDVCNAVTMTTALPVQPGTGATWAVTGAFFQATQPVSLASVPTHAVTGPQASGATVSTNPNVVAGVDGGGAIRPLATDASGHVQCVGSAAAGDAQAGNLFVMGGSDGSNFRYVLTDSNGKLLVSAQGATAGGCTAPYSFLSTATVQAANVKASAGQVYGLHFFNTGATPVYVRLYDKATAPLTSDTPVYRAVVPGNTAGAGFVVNVPPGVAFGTGIGIRVTAAAADNDATALAANGVLGNVLYK